MEIINSVLEILPEKYKTDGNNAVKKKVYPPGRLSMIINDPSEAVESETIESLLPQYFSVCKRKPYGGTVLQNLLKDIAHHFIEDDADAMKLLKMVFAIEDHFLSTGELKSDFVFFVCKKKNF